MILKWVIVFPIPFHFRPERRPYCVLPCFQTQTVSSHLHISEWRDVIHSFRDLLRKCSSLHFGFMQKPSHHTAWTWRFRRNIGACHRNNNVSHYFAERDSLLRLLRFLRDNNVMVYNVSGFSQGLVNNRSLTFDSSFILKWNQTYQFERVWKPIIINSVQKVCWSFWSMESAPYMKVTFG